MGFEELKKLNEKNKKHATDVAFRKLFLLAFGQVKLLFDMIRTRFILIFCNSLKKKKFEYSLEIVKALDKTRDCKRSNMRVCAGFNFV
jgi:hypothetical protein